jgi:hypothetical protein
VPGPLCGEPHFLPPSAAVGGHDARKHAPPGDPRPSDVGIGSVPPRPTNVPRFLKLSYFGCTARGGHFAAREEPQLCAEELRAAFQALRGGY